MYNIILGNEILSKLKIYLCLYENTIRGGGGYYKGYNVTMRDVSNINFNSSPNWLNDKIFWGEE